MIVQSPENGVREPGVTVRTIRVAIVAVALLFGLGYADSDSRLAIDGATNRGLLAVARAAI